MTVLDDPALALLAEGRQLHVGVLTTTGPHVTPELYAVADGDVWFATAADTLKRRVLRRDPRLGAVVRVGSRALVLTGAATDYDLADPVGLVAQARDGLRALRAVGAFTLRNAADLGAFARDLAGGRLPSRLPTRRVLVRLRPQSWAIVDGTRLLAAGGAWSQPGPAEVAPDGEAGPLDGDRDAVVGWEHDRHGVLALPARLRGETATVPAVLARLAGLDDGAAAAACAVVDDYTAAGPAAKTGTLLRGRATLRIDGACARLDLDVDRETTWDGAETATETRDSATG